MSSRPINFKPSTNQPAVAVKGHLLLADDEAGLLQGYQRILNSAGYHVLTALSGEAAVTLLQTNKFDAVVSDLSMPGMDGLELLRVVREHDLDVPVILMTGAPAVETAITAIEHGAFRYLIKPVEPQNLLSILAQAILLHKMAQAKREALQFLGQEAMQVGDRAGLDACFSNALKTLTMFYQPIVSWQSKKIYAYEALVRTEESSLPHPGALLDAAERLGRLNELSRTIRHVVANNIGEAPVDTLIFMNLHTLDLLDGELYEPSSPLVAFAQRLVLEITERAALDAIQDIPKRIGALRSLGYRIAIDDLGAGYAGLNSFAQLEPNVVKLDMSLIRDVHLQPTKRKLIQTMVNLCQELKISVIAEGIETLEERDTLAQLGIDLMQGFLFARPGKHFPNVAW